MRNENSVVYSLFQFLHGPIGIKEKKLIWVEDSTAGAKRNKENLFLFSGDDLCSDQFETSTSPPRAHPGHLTVHRARGGGNLNVALKGGEFEPDLSLVLT